MSLRLRKHGEIREIDGEKSPDIARQTHRRRLRLACTAVYFTKVLESPTKKVLRKNLGILRSLSYVAIDIPEEAHRPVPRIKPKSLSGMVRERISHEALAWLGGVGWLAPALETDLEAGLAGDAANLAQSKTIFGENGYTKPTAKQFLTFILEAFKYMT